MNPIVSRYVKYIKTKIKHDTYKSFVKYSTYCNHIVSDYNGFEIPELLLQYYNNRKYPLKNIMIYGGIGILYSLCRSYIFDASFIKNLDGYTVGGILSSLYFSDYFNREINWSHNRMCYKGLGYTTSINDYFQKNGSIYTSKLYGIKNNSHCNNNIFRKIYHIIKYDILGYDIKNCKDVYVKYDGTFEGLRYNGYGKLYYPNGQLLVEGDFLDGLPIWGKKIYTMKGNLLFENKNITNIYYLRFLHRYTIDKIDEL